MLHRCCVSNVRFEDKVIVRTSMSMSKSVSLLFQTQLVGECTTNATVAGGISAIEC